MYSALQYNRITITVHQTQTRTHAPIHFTVYSFFHHRHMSSCLRLHIQFFFTHPPTLSYFRISSYPAPAPDVHLHCAWYCDTKRDSRSRYTLQTCTTKITRQARNTNSRHNKNTGSVRCNKRVLHQGYEYKLALFNLLAPELFF